MVKKEVKSIGIIGGGTAGYLTALALHKILPHLEITLVESSKIPIIGVGEATTPQTLRMLHTILKLDIDEFHKKVKPTWKLGIKFFWGQLDSPPFNAPFGHFEAYEAMTITGNINNCSIGSQMMSFDKAPMFYDQHSDKPKMLHSYRLFAYHLDNKKMVSYLKELIDATSIRHLDREVVNIKIVHDQIKNVVCSNGESLNYDLYVDCTGFKSVLLGNGLKVPFIDYNTTLFTDRAIVANMEHHGDIKPYTSAITMKHGWLWNTPLQDEDHLGYVYSSTHASEDEIREEFKSKFPSARVKDHVIKYRSGRYKDFWKGNVLAIGNSLGFVEPLESTGIHMIVLEIVELLRVLKKGYYTQDDQKALNESIGNKWDMLRWFLGLHYKYNKKEKSVFWTDCHHSMDLSGIEEHEQFFREKGPVSLSRRYSKGDRLNFDGVFSPAGHDYFLMAQGIEPGNLFNQYSKEDEERFRQKIKLNDHFVQKAMHMKEALNVMADQPKLMSIDGWFNDEFKEVV